MLKLAEQGKVLVNVERKIVQKERNFSYFHLVALKQKEKFPLQQ